MEVLKTEDLVSFLFESLGPVRHAQETSEHPRGGWLTPPLRIPSHVAAIALGSQLLARKPHQTLRSSQTHRCHGTRLHRKDSVVKVILRRSAEKTMVVVEKFCFAKGMGWAVETATGNKNQPVDAPVRVAFLWSG